MADTSSGKPFVSLVKYDKPEVVFGTRADKKGNRNPEQNLGAFVICGTEEVIDEQLVEICKESSTSQIETEAILNSIAPAREWEEDGKRYRQLISKLAATRTDIMDLNDGLNEQLTNRQARPDGICPIRRLLADQAFDELIRQITISQPERGLLLLRVRDELKMTLLAYQDLFVSSRDYDPYKNVLKESYTHKLELEAKLEGLVAQVTELKTERDAVQKLMNNEDAIFREKQEAENKKHTEEFQFLKRVNNVLKQHMDAMLEPNNNIDPTIAAFDHHPKNKNKQRKGKKDKCKDQHKEKK